MCTERLVATFLTALEKQGSMSHGPCEESATFLTAHDQDANLTAKKGKLQHPHRV